MANIAQPIIRGDFHHDGYHLLVNVAGKLYSRACESDIRARLYGWQQDRPASWWEAQVVHYNLLRTNLKDMCKSRLWEAIEQGGLKAQPANVAAMAEEMRKEFESAVREAGRLGFPGAGMSVRPAKRGRCDEGGEDDAKKAKVATRNATSKKFVGPSKYPQPHPSARECDPYARHDPAHFDRDQPGNVLQKTIMDRMKLTLQRMEAAMNQFARARTERDNSTPKVQDQHSTTPFLPQRRIQTPYPQLHAPSKKYDPYARDSSPRRRLDIVFQHSTPQDSARSARDTRKSSRRPDRTTMRKPAIKRETRTKEATTHSSPTHCRECGKDYDDSMNDSDSDATIKKEPDNDLHR